MATRNALKTNYEIKAGTLFEDFENYADWTKDANGTIASDTTYFKTGTKSLKFTTAAGSYVRATKTISQSFAGSGKRIGFWVYVPDNTKFKSWTIYISSSTTLASYFWKSWTNVYTKNGWNFFSVNATEFANYNSESWENTMVRLRIRVDGETDQVGEAYIDSIYYEQYAKPKILITFDDGWDTQYSAAYTYMATKGLKGTIYTIGSLIGTTNYCTLANLQTMYSAGWDLGVHGLTNLTTLTKAEQLVDISTNKEYLITNGFTRAIEHYAYPNGGYNDDAISNLQALGFKTGRTILSRLQDTIKGVDNPFLLTTRVLGGDALTLAATQGYVDNAIASGGTYILYAHKIVSGTPANTNEWDETRFNGLIDYIKARQDEGLLDVVTISEWYNGLVARQPVTTPRTAV